MEAGGARRAARAPPRRAEGTFSRIRRTEERAGHDKRRASRTRGARHRRANERDERALRHRAGRRERVRRRHGSGVDEGARGKVLSGWTAVPRYFRPGIVRRILCSMLVSQTRARNSRARASPDVRRGEPQDVCAVQAGARQQPAQLPARIQLVHPVRPTRHRLGLTRTTLFSGHNVKESTSARSPRERTVTRAPPARTRAPTCRGRLLPSVNGSAIVVCSAVAGSAATTAPASARVRAETTLRLLAPPPTPSRQVRRPRPRARPRLPPLVDGPSFSRVASLSPASPGSPLAPDPH